MTAVVISTGAVLGKANPVQLIVMTLLELIIFHVSRCINRTLLEVPWWRLQTHGGGKSPWSFGTALSGAAAEALCGLKEPTDGESGNQLKTETTVLLLQVPEHLALMHVHLFGAYFGLAVTSRFPEPPPGLDKNRSTPKSDLFSMLGESLAAMALLEEGIAGRAWGGFGGFECKMQP